MEREAPFAIDSTPRRGIPGRFFCYFLGGGRQKNIDSRDLRGIMGIRVSPCGEPYSSQHQPDRVKQARQRIADLTDSPLLARSVSLVRAFQAADYRAVTAPFLVQRKWDCPLRQNKNHIDSPPEESHV